MDSDNYLTTEVTILTCSIVHNSVLRLCLLPPFTLHTAQVDGPPLFLPKVSGRLVDRLVDRTETVEIPE